MKKLLGFILALSLSSAYPGCMPMGMAMRGSSSTDSLWTREELYFGRDIPGGGKVTDSLWQSFLDEEVTPRFPKGLTVLDGSGQYQYGNGVIAKEQTKIVILLYRENETQHTGLIDQLVGDYKQRFRQESVLRITNRVTAKFQ